MCVCVCACVCVCDACVLLSVYACVCVRVCVCVCVTGEWDSSTEDNPDDVPWPMTPLQTVSSTDKVTIQLECVVV